MADKKRDNRPNHGTDPKTRPMRWEYDILKKDFIPRQYPRAVPNTGIFDEDIYCLKFNEMWIPHIIGALQLLLEKDSWSGGDSEIFRAQQSILLMLENLTAPCDSGELNMRTPEFRSIVINDLCDQTQWKYVDEPDSAWRNLGTQTCDGEDGTDGTNGSSPEFQIVAAGAGCQLIQWRYEGDITWNDLATVCDGADGTNGADGTDGDDGREAEFRTINEGSDCFQVQWRYVGDSVWNNAGDLVCCECEETVPVNPTVPVEEDGLLCSIAINLASALREKFNQSYDNDASNFAIVSGGTGVITAITAILFPGIAVAVAVGAGIVSFVTFLHTLISGGEANAFDDPAEEQFRCDLYCILRAHDSAEITSGIIDEWATKIEEYAIMGEQRFALSLFLREASPLDYWQWVAYASSEVNPAACDCICDEDRLISWELATSNADEGTTHIVKLKLTSPVGDVLPSDVDVVIQAVAGTATSPADYLLLGTGFTFPAGSVNGDTVDVEITIASDATSDDGETFTLEIVNIDGAAVIDETANIHTVTIEDDDGLWCYEWLFNEAQGAWFPRTVAGQGDTGLYVAGTGWTPRNIVESSIGRRTCDIVLSHTGLPATMTKVEVEFDYTAGSPAVGSASAHAIIDRTTGAVILQNMTGTAATSGTGIIFSWTGSRSMSAVNVVITSSRDASSPYTFGGDCLIKRIRLEGTGSNPFGSDNC